MNNLKDISGGIFNTALMVLEGIGVKIQTPEIIEIFRKLSFFDERTGRVYLPSDYTLKCRDLAPESFPIDPGPNKFGIGGTPSEIEDKDDLDELAGVESLVRLPTEKDLRNALRIVTNHKKVFGFSHVPFSVPGMTRYEIAKIMGDILPKNLLKGLGSATEMNNDQMKEFACPGWFLHFTGIMPPLREGSPDLLGIVRAARQGTNLALISMPLSGWDAPGSLWGLLVQLISEILFQLVLAQTVTPGITCAFYGLPCPGKVIGPEQVVSMMGSPKHALANAIASIIGKQILRLPTFCTGSTCQPYLNKQAIYENKKTRNFLRNIDGVDKVSHAFGLLNDLRTFNFKKLLLDIEVETEEMNKPAEAKIINAADIPEDENVLDAFERVVLLGDGNFYHDAHTLRYVDVVQKWD